MTVKIPEDIRFDKSANEGWILIMIISSYKVDELIMIIDDDEKGN